MLRKRPSQWKNPYADHAASVIVVAKDAYDPGWFERYSFAAHCFEQGADAMYEGLKKDGLLADHDQFLIRVDKKATSEVLERKKGRKHG